MFRCFFSSILNRITSGAARDGVPLLNISPDDSQSNVNTPSVATVQIEPDTTTNDDYLHDNGAHLRAKLRFFFMSPCWKWHLKRQFPWKAWFQFLKIIIITTQVNKAVTSFSQIDCFFSFDLVDFIWYRSRNSCDIYFGK
jgi:hypothetical protein